MLLVMRIIIIYSIFLLKILYYLVKKCHEYNYCDKNVYLYSVQLIYGKLGLRKFQVI